MRSDLAGLMVMMGLMFVGCEIQSAASELSRNLPHCTCTPEHK